MIPFESLRPWGIIIYKKLLAKVLMAIMIDNTRTYISLVKKLISSCTQSSRYSKIKLFVANLNRARAPFLAVAGVIPRSAGVRQQSGNDQLPIASLGHGLSSQSFYLVSQSDSDVDRKPEFPHSYMLHTIRAIMQRRVSSFLCNVWNFRTCPGQTETSTKYGISRLHEYFTKPMRRSNSVSDPQLFAFEDGSTFHAYPGKLSSWWPSYSQGYGTGIGLVGSSQTGYVCCNYQHWKTSYCVVGIVGYQPRGFVSLVKLMQLAIPQSRVVQYYRKHGRWVHHTANAEVFPYLRVYGGWTIPTWPEYPRLGAQPVLVQFGEVSHCRGLRLPARGIKRKDLNARKVYANWDLRSSRNIGSPVKSVGRTEMVKRIQEDCRW